MKLSKINYAATGFLFVLILGIFTAAPATNGYFSHGYGTQSKGMAGIGAAFPGNTISAATNPANLILVGQRYDISLAVFNPNREYTIGGQPSMMPNTFGLAPGTIESDSKWFIIPAIGANWLLDPNGSIGIALYGNGGMNTDYNTNAFQGSTPSGVNLSQLFVTGTYSRRLSERHSFGLSAVLAYQMFSADGLEAFSNFSRTPSKLTNNNSDNSTGFGFKLGYHGNLFQGFSLGAAYHSKIFMSEFSEYEGLFAEQGDFDIPASWTAGIAYKINPELIVAVDVQQILYSGIAAVNNPMNPAAFQQNILLGDDDGAGFGWEDMTIFKIGLQWEAARDLKLRAGYSFGEQPIPESEVMFNILAPGVIEQHITFGISKIIAGKETSLAIMHALSNSISGPNPMEVPGQQTIELQMNQLEIEFGIAF